MNCPACKKNDSRVVDTREQRGGQRYRRHECRKCSHRWSTYESSHNGNRLFAELREIRRLQIELNKRFASLAIEVKNVHIPHQ